MGRFTRALKGPQRVNTMDLAFTNIEEQFTLVVTPHKTTHLSWHNMCAMKA